MIPGHEEEYPKDKNNDEYILYPHVSQAFIKPTHSTKMAPKRKRYSTNYGINSFHHRMNQFHHK